MILMTPTTAGCQEERREEPQGENRLLTSRRRLGTSLGTANPLESHLRTCGSRAVHSTYNRREHLRSVQ